MGQNTARVTRRIRIPRKSTQKKQFDEAELERLRRELTELKKEQQEINARIKIVEEKYRKLGGTIETRY